MVSLTNFRRVGDASKAADAPSLIAAASLGSDWRRESLEERVFLAEGAACNARKYSFDAQQTAAEAAVDDSERAPFEIRWSNLSYSVDAKWHERQLKRLRGDKPARKTIVRSLHGSVRSGAVTAILGPSGAGKTSLLGCLTGKHKAGVSGVVQVLSRRQTPLSICTIPQKDYLLSQLTVRENLWFASRLKQPTRRFDHHSNIERVLEMLKLHSCVDTPIGKISGGQHKRVSIAQELLSNPDILILDEPTSGLDSLTCYKTVMVLRELAQLSPNPMAIIVTIHQPQREVFDLFHWVYILATGGRCIYEGMPQASVATINACSSGQLKFDERLYNPASFLVEIASGEFGAKPIDVLVENQAREFRRRVSLVDGAASESSTPATARNDAAAADDDARLGQRSPQLQLPTPLQLRKRQSAIEKLRSTISNLGGKSPVGSPLVAQLNRQRAPLAYANDAFDAQLGGGGGDDAKRNAAAAADLQPQQQQQQQLPALSSQCELLAQLESSSDFYLDERLQTHKHNHDGHFYRHCSLLTRRSWLCLAKDPMLTTLRFTAHILVPLLITIVYGSRVGKPNACPLYETQLDLIDYARRGTARLLNLQDELRSTFENVGLYFLSVYAFTFSTMCLTSLSFPLSMHVLLKEVRNGWYSIPTYFIGKTIADFPLEFVLPAVTLVITYPLTGQPASLYQWRFFVATGVFVVTSLIAQTQGLIFGALFMNAMQAAVFIAPVSTTPLILLSGFLIRISKMPVYLQHLSCFSYFRYAMESLTIIRYGFGQCDCDPAIVTGAPVNPVGVPDQLRTMTNYWLSTFDAAAAPSALDDDAPLNATTTLAPSVGGGGNGEQPDFFQELTVLLARANSFGANITTCDDVKPYPMLDFSLEDRQLYIWCSALATTLVVFKIVNYFVVKYSVKWRL